MKLQFIFSLLVMLAFATIGFAQSKVKLYRAPEGRLYTVAQKDSIRDLGFPLSLTDETTRGDTTIIDFEVMPKENEFVQKYKNKPLPYFSLKDLDGNIVSSESLKGKVVMINFWSTTCGPCILEMPQLNQLEEQYKDVVFLAPAPENVATIRKLLAKHPFNFVILPDAKQFFADWGIEGYPKNFFVDSSGIIREVKEGTPILHERDKEGKLQIAVVQMYSPILSELEKGK